MITQTSIKCLVSRFQFMQTRCKNVNLCLVGCVQHSFKVCGINFLSKISFHFLNSHLLIHGKISLFRLLFFTDFRTGYFCFALHKNGYTDLLLGAPTVILNKMTCGYISNEWATPFFSTQFCYWAAVHLVPVNCLLSILNNMKLAEYELKLIFVITRGAKYPKQPVYRNKWLLEEIKMLYIRLLWERWS